MPQPQSGISKRTLLLLGGLTALLASPSARAKLGELVQGTLGSAQDLLDDTVAPAAQHAAHAVAVRAGELTEEARKVAAQAQDHLPDLIDSVREQAGQRGQQLLDSTADLRGDLAGRAVAAAAVAAKTAASVQGSLSSTVANTVSNVQDTVQGRLSDAQHVADKRRKVLVSEARDLRGDLARTVSKKAKQGKKMHKQVQQEAKAGWLGFLENAQDQADDARDVAQKKLGHAGKDARKQVQEVKKQVQKNWPSFADEAQDRVQSVSAEARRKAQAQFGSLDKRSRKQVKGYEKKIARLEQELARTAHKQLRKAGLGRKRGVGGLLPVALIVGGGVVLARVPAARQGILDAVGAVSPEAAEWLHDAGRSVRNAIGTAWLERMEDVNHAPAPQAPSPKPSQATGSAAGASVAPDAPAATPAPVDPNAKQDADVKADAKADVKKN
ncbi:alginate biosynthesis protein AlgP [Deinococcus rubellus]|uniref:Alginate biosynthesis protein AlgP n=1 Tax=Deinococcus rubellus TaxID=1889240 RepID=A0ABY5YHU5_9DEIO|nr:hypothetical protein [Deinococcus rubellus]UWX63368.1 hypothetical protein N0D28_11495 [Deinococcus rubellus]